MPRLRQTLFGVAGAFLVAFSAYAQTCYEYRWQISNSASVGWVRTDDLQSPEAQAHCEAQVQAYLDYANANWASSLKPGSLVWANVSSLGLCEWESSNGDDGSHYVESREVPCPEPCTEGNLHWHEERKTWEEWGTNDPPQELVIGQCVLSRVGLGEGCGDLTAEDIGNHASAGIGGWYDDGTYGINVAYCSTQNQAASGISYSAPATPDEPAPREIVEVPSTNDSVSPTTTTTLADGTVREETTEITFQDLGAVERFEVTDWGDGVPYLDESLLADFYREDSGYEEVETVTIVDTKPDGTVIETVTKTITVVSPSLFDRDVNIPATDGDPANDFTSENAETTTTVETTTTTTYPDGSSTTESTTETDTDGDGDADPPPEEEPEVACPDGVQCEFDQSLRDEADASYEDLKASIEDSGYGGEVGSAVSSSDLPGGGSSMLPGYSSCQSITTSWGALSFTFPGADGCAKLEVLKSMLNWAAWVLLAVLLYSLIVRKPG